MAKKGIDHGDRRTDPARPPQEIRGVEHFESSNFHASDVGCRKEVEIGAVSCADT